MAKTVKFKGTFEIVGADGVVESKNVIDSSGSVSEVTKHFPQKIAPSTSDAEISFGGVASAKRLFIKTSHEVTIKLNVDTDAGASYGPGETVITSATGITALFITTGVNETEVEIVIAGE